jgi:S-adenosylmethionine:tRNA ribosyltransferase-isomerase
MQLTQFDYHLPYEYIAQLPVRPRDHSKLMFVDRKSGTVSHHHFFDLPSLLPKDCVLVLNNTKVFPARLVGKKDTSGKVEVLLIKQTGPQTWEVFSKPGINLNQKLYFSKDDHSVTKYINLLGLSKRLTTANPTHQEFEPILSAVVCAKNNELGMSTIRFEQSPDSLFDSIQKIGKIPLPPYIKQPKKGAKAGAQERDLFGYYQTIYAKHIGSVAAPTAGFHFTENLFATLKNLGIEHYFVTLHVGPGTFSPVKLSLIENHRMHQEWFELSSETAAALNLAKKQGKKIIAVGTTSCRVLESAVNNLGTLKPLNSSTNLYVYPPYKFNFVDGLITNFHLPKSTLLMLVSAFVSQPNTNEPFESFEKSLIGRAYQKAIKNNYRFFSFGDAMLII